ncbi:MAG TPA: VOC family protein [Candidatus Pullichristensenella excrementigallinarum]|uniref:VOC family protein n=1 Tax=Candidatus Pullichristensenella excrementigallinarum TaxID=2840907 RepID=A0A9D1ICJ7_9FIRM|nr:VOC family protein [Candidatus Pullichristensenella excrementigallinarum]
MEPKDNIIGLQHIGLPAKDFDETVEFYKTFGFELVYETVNEGNRVGFLRLHNVTIETWQEANPALRAGAVDHFALDVREVEPLYELALSKGYPIKDPEGLRFLPFWEKGIRFFNVIGPNGETVEFSQML